MMETRLRTQARAAPSPSFTPVWGGVLQRKCACGGSPGIAGQCEECSKKQLNLQRSAANQAEPSTVPPIVHEVLRSPGQPLDKATRAFMEPRLGHDFSRVRVHTDARAAESAAKVNALAYTVGRNVVFGAGQYTPGTTTGGRLLAHELTHTVQQSRGGISTLSGSMRVSEPGNADEREAEAVAEKVIAVSTNEIGTANIHPATSVIQRMGDPTKIPPGLELECEIASDSPSPTEALLFGNNVSTLSGLQQAQVDNFVLNWQAAGGNAPVRVDGYASIPGTDDLNWRLSCNRAEEVVNELTTPSSGTPGIPAGFIRTVAQGETTQFGAEADNRRATISSRITLPPTPPPSPAPCALPVLLGVGRTGCGSGTDFTHFDFPSISFASDAKLAAWAAAHPFSGPFRSRVTDTECELEMDAVLSGLAGGAGHAAFTRFAAGTGGTETHGTGSTLGAMALISGSFLTTVSAVKTMIEAQLAAQAASGTLDPCALSVVPPGTFFGFSDGVALKAVIGGTHGERLFATGFTGSIPSRNYTVDLRFRICDNFGVDESDLYAPGLFGFWVLQHERSASLYAPFINELDLPVTVSGTF